MPKPTYRFCRECGRDRAEVGLLSHTRLCGECAGMKLRENIDGLHTMSGEALLRWRRGMVACAGGVLLDEAREGR